LNPVPAITSVDPPLKEVVLPEVIEKSGTTNLTLLIASESLVNLAKPIPFT